MPSRTGPTRFLLDPASLASCAGNYALAVPGDDWPRVVAPAPLQKAIARRRLGVRAALIVVDAAIVTFLVVSTVLGEARWWWFLQLATWAVVTWQFGWLIPGQVDRWHRQELGADQSPPPSPRP